ncbi:hypothetical protein GSI_01415 [Ganoderma sinense ZZ0214-1]|uniref:Aspartic peptidase DDI1-type domain-containing protein n=1 Tax=Ganoderma sinense ZZ0214-1 TaxID=1077348 RepID=A0A2G8SVD3_9APHY|nr:hypothetical protein GSI_01415 [Ganoderma sinense ZZ0214-1]
MAVYGFGVRGLSAFALSMPFDLLPPASHPWKGPHTISRFSHLTHVVFGFTDPPPNFRSAFEAAIRSYFAREYRDVSVKTALGIDLTLVNDHGETFTTRSIQMWNIQTLLEAEVRSPVDHFVSIANASLSNLEADLFSPNVQWKVEETDQWQAVLGTLEHALEYPPSVSGGMPVEVNGRLVKPFIFSGVQSSYVLSRTTNRPSHSSDATPPAFFSLLHSRIMRFFDRLFSGIAQGVGTARILGRVHSAQLKLADLHLPCSFTIMEGRAVDLLFGLDMLKAHQACIDLEKNVLRIQGREVSFLAEHELPDKARNPEAEAEAEAAAASASGSGAGAGGTARSLGRDTRSGRLRRRRVRMRVREGEGCSGGR